MDSGLQSPGSPYTRLRAGGQKVNVQSQLISHGDMRVQPILADPELNYFHTEMKQGMSKGSFSKRLLQNLQYARQWGMPVSAPTFDPKNFSPNQTTRNSKPKGNLFDTSPWQEQKYLPEGYYMQKAGQITSLPMTSYA